MTSLLDDPSAARCKVLLVALITSRYSMRYLNHALSVSRRKKDLPLSIYFGSMPSCHVPFVFASSVSFSVDKRLYDGDTTFGELLYFCAVNLAYAMYPEVMLPKSLI